MSISTPLAINFSSIIVWRSGISIMIIDYVLYFSIIVKSVFEHNILLSILIGGTSMKGIKKCNSKFYKILYLITKISSEEIKTLQFQFDFKLASKFLMFSCNLLSLEV